MATAPPCNWAHADRRDTSQRRGEGETGSSEPLPILRSSGTYKGILSHSPVSQQCHGESKSQPIHILKAYPCAFYSRKLNPAEQNYDVGNRELLAMKAAFEEWRHWLEGAKHPFTVLTDHCNLEYLRSAKRLNHRQARWALFFTCFDFTVTYRPGSLNTKADALSRQYESSILPPTKESIISPSLSPLSNGISWPRSLRPRSPTHLRLKVLLTSHSPAYTTPQSHPASSLYPQFRPSRHSGHYTTAHQSLLVAHSASRHHHPHPELSHMQHVKILSPTSCRSFTTSTHSTTPLVAYSHRICHIPAAIQRSHHHSLRHWPLFQGLSPDPSAQTAYSPWNCRILMRSRI